MSNNLHVYTIVWEDPCRDDVVAHSAEEAVEWAKQNACRDEDDPEPEEVRQLPDDEVPNWVYVDEPGQPRETRTAGEIAFQFGRVGLVGTCA